MADERDVTQGAGQEHNDSQEFWFKSQTYQNGFDNRKDKKGPDQLKRYHSHQPQSHQPPVYHQPRPIHHQNPNPAPAQNQNQPMNQNQGSNQNNRGGKIQRKPQRKGGRLFDPKLVKKAMAVTGERDLGYLIEKALVLIIEKYASESLKNFQLKPKHRLLGKDEQGNDVIETLEPQTEGDQADDKEIEAANEEASQIEASQENTPAQ